MSKELIFQAALDLVFAWDAKRQDDGERARLAKVVRDFLTPLPTIACSVEQGRGSIVGRGGHFLKPAAAEQLVHLLKVGFTHRAAARSLGINRKTVKRYDKLNGPFTCPCGRENTHRGWCKERIKHSPLRQAFLAQWFAQQVAAGTRRSGSPKPAIIIDRRIVDANWPYLSGKPGDGGALVDAVNAIVPRGFPDYQRADICQDLLLALLEGNATIENIADGSAACIKRYYKLHPGKFGPLSLDAVIPGTERLTLGDTIRSDAPHF